MFLVSHHPKITYAPLAAAQYIIGFSESVIRFKDTTSQKKQNKHFFVVETLPVILYVFQTVQRVQL